jgi:hypothetical protein
LTPAFALAQPAQISSEASAYIHCGMKRSCRR